MGRRRGHHGLRSIAGFALAGVVAWHGGPQADAAEPPAPSKAMCADAYHDAQELRLDGKLTAARGKLITCSHATCPPTVSADCTKWLGEVNEQQPTIVVVAKGVDGRDVLDVLVLLDGQPIAERLSSRAMPLDPGSHVLRFEHRGQPAIEQEIVVREGIKNRPVEVSFAKPAEEAQATTTPPAEPAPTSDEGAPVGAFVLGGIGLASLGVFAGLAAAGTAQVDDLRDSCGQTSTCTDDEIDSARRTLIVGDVFMFTGIAAVGASAVWLIVHYGGASEQPADRADAQRAGRLELGVAPWLDGVRASATWSF
ncbi:MAG: hypothetical protein JRI23_28260 [Deltaproteobacteria bacterium]|jgi:hypothetical protein|nr:hypothetical protein [Deltaproteobacteria bacterium]MBW2535992.1 hypothetical protein [Deltaproteobacteria bacterium]